MSEGVCIRQTPKRPDMHRRCMLAAGKFIESYKLEMNRSEAEMWR